MFSYVVLTPISTTSGLEGTGNMRKYHQIDVYIYQCVKVVDIVIHQFNIFLVLRRTIGLEVRRIFSITHSYLEAQFCYHTNQYKGSEITRLWHVISNNMEFLQMYT